MKAVAWSYSRLDSFETCPRKFWHLSVEKDLKELESEAMAEGKAIHKAFELRLSKGKALPVHLRVHESAMAMIANGAGEKLVEQQICLDVNWQPVEWYSKDAWLRVKSDLTQYNGSYGVVWDWKTGRPHDDFTQPNLNAAVLLHLAPEITSVMPVYYWTKTRRVVSGEKITRVRVSDIWGPILKRVALYQAAHETNSFPPRENPFCKGCVVITCQYRKPPR
jgi:CRISPR/Cas system-associated exonuclease Cas4 (RecB family)